MSKYFLHGKLSAKAGNGQQLADILLEASKLVSQSSGCHFYLIGREKDHDNDVFVTELWDSKSDHDNSLNVEGVKELIMKAIPLLEGPPNKGQELSIIGGFGL